MTVVMSAAALLSSLSVGFLPGREGFMLRHDVRAFGAEPDAPAGYDIVHYQSRASGRPQTTSGPSVMRTPARADAGAVGNLELAQSLAHEIAADPSVAADAVTTALSRTDEGATLGDVATLAAAAIRAAPGQAPAIAGAVTSALRDRGDAVLAAAIATIIAMVPAQSHDIGLVVGAILGEDLEALGMIARTVAIATGEATFGSLSKASGVSAALIRTSSEFGSAVPFDVPAYAAQAAPSPGRMAQGTTAPAADSRPGMEM